VAQHLVADGMTMGVVDRLEIVEIAKNQDAEIAIAFRRRQGAVQLVIEAAAVEQRRQLVGHRQVAEILDARVLIGESLLDFGCRVQRPLEHGPLALGPLGLDGFEQATGQGADVGNQLGVPQ
jgi:hypothetical protein